MWSDSGQILLLPLLEIDILTEVLEVGNDSDPTQCTNYNICLFLVWNVPRSWVWIVNWECKSFEVINLLV